MHDIEHLIEAEAAFPAIEEAALDAEREIMFGMRVFDAGLALRSERARATGAETWADLLAARAAAGVTVRILLTDFEPVVGAKLHEQTWRALEGFANAAEAAGAADRMHMLACLHPGEIGRLLRLMFWPVVRLRLHDLHAEKAVVDLERAPGLWRYVRRRGRETRQKLFPAMRLWPATYHQKMATFDGRLAVVGGIDLAERMYDTARHDRPAEETWHDVSVMAGGPVAAAARAHLRAEWNANAPIFNARVTRMGAPFNAMLRPVSPMQDDAGAKPPAAADDVDFLRTRSRRSRSPFAYGPKPDVVEIENALVEEILRAERLIYLETQFLRSPAIADALAEAGRRAADANLIIVLPAAPEDVAFEGNEGADARYGERLQVDVLEKIAAAWGPRAGVFTLAQPRRAETPVYPRAAYLDAPIVYVHAKVAIFDGATAIVGSANLNGRSLRWDMETALRWRDPKNVGRLQAALWRTHFADAPPAPEDEALAAWRRRAEANADMSPEARRGFVLPYDIGPAKDFGRRRFWVPVNML